MIYLNYIYETLINIVLILIGEIVLFFVFFKPLITKSLEDNLGKLSFKENLENISNKTNFFGINIEDHITNINNYITILKYYKPIEIQFIECVNDKVVFFLIMLPLSLIIAIIFINLVAKNNKIELKFNIYYSIASLITLLSLELLFIFFLNLELKINKYDALEILINKTKEHIQSI